MSRRTSLSTLGRQQRAASRMTPGTRMWSEQPYINPVGRAVVTEPDYVKPLVLPTSWNIRSETWRGAVPLSSPQPWVFDFETSPHPSSRDGADQIVLISHTGLTGFVLDPDAGEVLHAGSVSGSRLNWWVLLRKGTPAQTMTVGRWNVGSENAENAGIAGGAIRVVSFKGMSGGRWTVTQQGQGMSNPVVFGPAPADAGQFRFRVLVSVGNYSGRDDDAWEATGWRPWAGYLNAEAHLRGDWNSQPLAPGYESGNTSTAWTVPAAFAASPYVEGSFMLGTIGAAGPLTWADLTVAYR